MPSTAFASKIFRLPRKKRLELAERLWLSAADETSTPVPESHKRILRERVSGYRAGKIKAISHSELLRRVSGL